MKIKNLITTIKKLKGFTKDGIIMKFTNEQIDDATTEYNRNVEITACDGTAQAIVSCAYAGDNADEKTYKVATSFIETVETLSSLGEEIEIEEVGNTLKVSCGSAVVSVGLLTEATTFEVKTVNEKTLVVEADAKSFADIISRGGFATGGANAGEFFAGTVVLVPVENKGKLMLKALSCCNAFLAEATTEVTVVHTDIFKKYASAGMGCAINHSAVSSLAKRFVSKKVHIVFADKQIILIDGMDSYMFTVIEGELPAVVNGALSDDIDLFLSHVLDREALRKALAVIALSGDDKVGLSFEGDKVVVTDSKYTSKVEVPTTAKKDEKGEIVLNINFLKSIITAFPESLEVYCAKGLMGIYFKGADCKAFLLGIHLPKSNS